MALVLFALTLVLMVIVVAKELLDRRSNDLVAVAPNMVPVHFMGMRTSVISPVTANQPIPSAPRGMRVVPGGQARDEAFTDPKPWDQTDGGYTLLEVTRSQGKWLQEKGMALAGFGNVADRPHPGELPVLCHGNGEDIYWLPDGEQKGTSEIAPKLFYMAVQTKLE